LFGLALVYLARAFSRLDLMSLLHSIGTRDWLVTGLCAIAYAASLGFLAKGWAAIAAPSGGLAFRTAVAVYAPGTVAKYLPGSVFHYASRQILGQRIGLAHPAMLKSSAFEAGLHVLTAVAMAGALWLFGWWAVVAFTVLGTGLLALRGRVIEAVACHLLFFAAFAAVILIVAGVAGPAHDQARLSAAFFLAWTAGLLVPFAPGGIGVREAALLTLATPFELPETVVAFALLARVACMAGDGLFGVAGYLATVRTNRQASA
jgi:uncharacterized membrane protein YbhN (UPF0104 family)